MATIKISELCPAGFNLLQDSESFLDELSDRETSNILGGQGEGKYFGEYFTVELTPSWRVESGKLDRVPPTNVKTIYSATVVTRVEK